MKSLEHSPKFHLARRIAKIVAPEFRVFATEQLEKNTAVLDLDRKTIEVSERSWEFEAVGGILFQLGHIRQLGDRKLSEHFGKFKTHDEKKLIKRLIRQGLAADKAAAEWAIEILIANWSIMPERAHAVIESYIWSTDDWQSYYENKN